MNFGSIFGIVVKADRAKQSAVPGEFPGGGSKS
jgi:hypothetical protein